MNLLNQIIIIKPLIGQPVEAKIIKQDGDKFYIDRDEKTYTYPNSFEKFLKFKDEKLQKEVEAELASRKAADGKAQAERYEKALRDSAEAKRIAQEKAESERRKNTVGIKENLKTKAKNYSTHKNYEIVAEIEETLKKANPSYADEIEGINKIYRTLHDNGELSLNDHIKAMVLSLLSNMRDWKPIEQNLDKIKDIFCNYDVNALKKKSWEKLKEEVTDLKCGNLKINSQMKYLKQNIETLECLNRDHGPLDKFYSETNKYELVDLLSAADSKYKLHEMGVALVCEYLKGVGIPLVKPDRHVCRIIGRLGFSENIPAGEIETLQICDKISESLNMSHAMVDTILWQYGVKEKCGICGDEPNCAQCGVTSCPNRSV